MVKCLILIGLIMVPFRPVGLGPNQGLSTPSSTQPEISLVKVFPEGCFSAPHQTACKGFSSTKIS